MADDGIERNQYGGHSMTSSDPIVVSDLKWLAKGMQRLIVRHPYDPSRILKIPYSGEVTDRRLRNAPVVAQPANRHILRERSVYRRFGARLAAHPDDAPIPQYYGQVATDLGPADEYEGVFSRNGKSLGMTLLKLKRSEKLDQAAVADLNAFVSRMDAWDIPASDINGRNIVQGFRGETSAFTLVDGFGDYRAIPLATYSRIARRRVTAASYRKIAARIGLNWDARARQFRA